MARKPLSKKVRFDVFKRDGFTCQYCGAHPPKVILECDHIHPVAEGGTDEIDNLITSCFNCNRGKAATPLTVIPKSLSEKAAEVSEREEQLRGYQEVLSQKRERLEREMWLIADTIQPKASEEGYLRTYLLSIKRFLEALGFDDVLEAAEIARANGNYYSENRRFRYFCGICHRKIRDQGGYNDGADS